MNRILGWLFLIMPITAYCAEVLENGMFSDAVKLDAGKRNEIAMSFDFGRMQRQEVVVDNITREQLVIPGEGMVYIEGRPVLPAVSRFIIVPPDKSVELVVEDGEIRRLPANLPPLLCVEKTSTDLDPPPKLVCEDGIFPPVIAEMSEPTVIRGIRLVRVTTYPVQFDAKTNAYLIRDNLKAELHFGDAPPVNPVQYPVRRHRSQTFLKFIRALALNGEEAGRDDPDRDILPPYVGHYLVVCHGSVMQFAVPFIEWRRKAGYKVDILCVPPNNANDANWIQTRIREIYDGYLRQGIDPFDLLMLVGDHSSYPGGAPGPQYILNTPSYGWNYGCLEGNDQNADVGIGQWISGSESQMTLHSGRTLAYEMNPRFDNPNWMRRGAAFAQNWGQGISVHTTVPWVLEAMKMHGIDDLRFYENLNSDGGGAAVWNFILDQFNTGVNILAGRAQVGALRGGWGNVRPTGIFPIYINYAGHQEYMTWVAMRSWNGNDLVGPVAATNIYGAPVTFSNNLLWLETMNGLLQQDLPFGWARVFAIIAPEFYIPNFPSANSIRTYSAAYGDPGLQPWLGVPRVVRAEYPATITPETRRIDVRVLNLNNEPVPGAQVTLYFPGNIPAPNNENYPAYNQMIMRTLRSDDDGRASFFFDERNRFIAITQMFVTITGRGIKPFLVERMISQPRAALTVSGWSLTEVEGNGDEVLNPGETHLLTITAKNTGSNDALQSIQANVSCRSQFVAVEEGNDVWFGDIAAGEEVQAANDVILRAAPDCPDGVSRPALKPTISVEFISGDDRWQSAIILTPRAPHYEFDLIPGGNIVRDTVCSIDIQIKNVGSLRGMPLDAELRSFGMGISVIDGISTYPSINAGASARQNSGRFVIAGNKVVVPGWRNKMALILRSPAGFVDTTFFELQILSPRANAPQGPDKYGYICFDDTDRGWDSAPIYNWCEIDPREQDYDIRGTQIPFQGNSPVQGEARRIDLPFRTRFYGLDYRQITVGSNGFICMGDQSRITNFQNWPMDRCIGGGAGMLAPFWDALSLGQNGRVYYAYDRENNRFIVEWSRLIHASGGNADLRFQAFILDADFWITESGNPDITFQYKSISQSAGAGGNWSTDAPFASVGISSPFGDTGLNYSFNNTGPVTSAPLEARRALLFSTSPRYRSSILHGYVRDYRTRQPIEGAIVRTRQGFVAITNNEGYWRIADALAEVRFDITATRTGFNDSTYTDTLVHENDSLEINFELLHPEFIPSTPALGWRLEPNHRIELPFNIYNGGNGPLTWSAEKRLLNDANAAPWTLRRSYAAGAATQDDRIEGVAFARDKFYVSGASSRPDDNGANRIWVFDRQGALIDSFPQPGNSTYGMKNLAWDSEWLWGGASSNENRVFAMTLEGQVVREFRGPHNPNTAVVWDSEHECLWLANVTNDLVAYDRNGNRLGRTLSRRGLRVYGLAYWPDDPDGYSLYIVNVPDQRVNAVHKLNIDTGDTLFVCCYQLPANGSPGGAFITNEFDVYSWVLMVISDLSRNEGGDRIDIFQVDARKDWMDLNRWRGLLNAEEWQEFVLTLNSTGLPDTLFEGEIRFYHNAEGLTTNIRIQLDVIGPEPPSAPALLRPPNETIIHAFPQHGDIIPTPDIRFAWLPSLDWNVADTVSYILMLTTAGDTFRCPAADTALVLNIDQTGLPVQRFEPFEWWVAAVSGPDTVPSVEHFRFGIVPDAYNRETAPPAEFGIHSIYPNPFNSMLAVKFGLDRTSLVSLSLFDLSGRQAAALVNSCLKAGYHTCHLDGAALTSGVYFVRLHTEDRTVQQKVVLVK